MIFSKKLQTLLIFSTCTFAACNSSKSSPQEPESPKTDPQPKKEEVGGEIEGQGSCTLEGDILKFKISCEKTVDSIKFGFQASGKQIHLKGSINGVQHDLEITNTGKGVEGYEKKVSKMEFTLHFTDGEKAEVKLWRKK